MLLIHPQFYAVAAIKLCNCFKVTIGIMVKSLSDFFLSGNGVRKDACIFVVTWCIDTGVFPNSVTGGRKLLWDFTMRPIVTLKQSLMAVKGEI